MILGIIMLVLDGIRGDPKTLRGIHERRKYGNIQSWRQDAG